MVKLKIFSDLFYASERDYEPMLYPFWGQPQVRPEEPLRGYYPNSIDFSPYIEQAPSFLEISSAKSADLLVIPNNWANWEEIQKPDPNIKTKKNILSIEFFERYQSLGKPFASFFGSDFSHVYSLPIPSELNFRVCLHHKFRGKGDFAMPLFCKDFLKTELDGCVKVRQKSLKPVVGFDGYVPPTTFRTYAKKLAWSLESFFLRPDHSRFNVGHLIRMKMLPYLFKSSLITPNFSVRNEPFFNLHNLEKQKQLQVDYIQNMINSDYILCPKGVGPISGRFYEILAFGKIPVFINSGAVLPYDFAVNWKDYCVWVEESEISKIDLKISEFHEKLSPQDFVDIQYECRRLWEEWCSPEGFFRNLYRHLELVV